MYILIVKAKLPFFLLTSYPQLYEHHQMSSPGSPVTAKGKGSTEGKDQSAANQTLAHTKCFVKSVDT